MFVTDVYLANSVMVVAQFNKASFVGREWYKKFGFTKRYCFYHVSQFLLAYLQRYVYHICGGNNWVVGEVSRENIMLLIETEFIAPIVDAKPLI
jgi:hypothetical protein